MIGMVVDTFTNGKRRAPRVVVAQRVIDKMVRGALLYPDEETAEAMIGLIIPREGSPDPDFYVLDTIAPDQSAIERQRYMVEQGDDLQGEIMDWLDINWKRFRELRRASYGSALAAKWDAPLRHLGDWHKQPGGMYAPSSGDLMTARDILRDRRLGMEALLAPIVTLWPPNALWEPTDGDIAVAVEDDNGDYIVRINFWYLARKMADFVAVEPEIQLDDLLPALPPVGWHLQDDERFQWEGKLLLDAGYALSVVEQDVDGVPPLEVCFMVARLDGGDHVYTLVTRANYPTTPPQIGIAPLLPLDEDDADFFATMWEHTRLLGPAELPPDWRWEPGMFLVDLLQAVEAQQAARAAT